jgi:hypothetical protein
MDVKRFAVAAAAAAAALSLPVAQAEAATADVSTESSSNWAGYAVSSSDSTVSLAYSSVSGNWTQPTATCTAGSQTYSAFWVGLGGFADGSQALEQIGTEVDCTADGRATYSVWYELVPAAPVSVKLKVRAGDRLSASVAVSGTNVTLKLRNVTRKTSFTKRLTTASPDVSSAEWIAEAPSACTSFGDCRPLPLTNFGTVTFTSVRATAAGHTGTITDAAWAATAIDLQGSGPSFLATRFAGVSTSADATPSGVSADGSGFAVTWAESQNASQPQPPA